jgi:hypothetical protein
MKNLLSENMMRFGTKNLTEAAKKDLVVKSIMETIEQHGLYLEVRKALTEADAPKPGFAFPYDTKFKDVEKLGVKVKGRIDDPETGGFEEYGPFVVQSPTSLTEASTILQEIIKILGTTGTGDTAKLAAAINKINANNYYAILWKVKYGTSFRAITKNNYNTVTDWISKKGFDIPSATGGGRGATTTSNSGGVSANSFWNDPVGNIAGGIRNLTQDPAIFNAVNRLRKYNSDEGRGAQ